MSLKVAPSRVYSHPQADGARFLPAYAPEAGEMSCWFIPETEAEELPVYEARLADVPDVLGECQFFEYYVLGVRLDWMLIENDHNEVLVIGPGGARAGD